MHSRRLINQSPVRRRTAAGSPHRHFLCREMLTVLAFAAFVGGCTTLKAVDMPPDELRNALRNGEVAQPGETVVLVTVAGERAVEFVEVDAVADVVRGRADNGSAVAVAVEDIVALRSVDADSGRSTLLGIAIALAIVLGVVVADAAEDLVEIFEP